jgi:hypothetical protein
MYIRMYNVCVCVCVYIYIYIYNEIRFHWNCFLPSDKNSWVPANWRVWDAGGRLIPKAPLICSAMSSHGPFPCYVILLWYWSPFVMCTESCNFTVLCTVQMPHQGCIFCTPSYFFGRYAIGCCWLRHAATVSCLRQSSVAAKDLQSAVLYRLCITNGCAATWLFFSAAEDFFLQE